MNPVTEAAVMRKVTQRLLPFLFLLYVIAYIDRVNVGFAKLHMNDLPWFNEAVYGFGAGIFFIGYFLFEVPSNLILQNVGARRWIARIMVSWGIIAMAMMFVNSERAFYGMRFLLGIAEAGFFPGVILYLTYWYTARERARVIALFMTANSVSYIVGGPISGLLLKMSGTGGLSGWQWLFLLEGLPAVLLGFVVLSYLPNGPAHAKWLSPEERDCVEQRLAADRGSNPVEHHTLKDALRYPLVWLFSGLYFTLVVGMYGISMWIPQIQQNSGKWSPLQVGLLTAVPYAVAGLVMVWNGTRSDRSGERRLHITIPAFFGAAGLIWTAYVQHSPWGLLFALSLAAAGMWATLGPFWATPTSLLRGTAAAGGIALINSIGNLGGFIGPYVVGYIKQATKQFEWGLFFLAGSVIAGGLIALAIPKRRPSTTEEAEPSPTAQSLVH